MGQRDNWDKERREFLESLEWLSDDELRFVLFQAKKMMVEKVNGKIIKTFISCVNKTHNYEQIYN